MEFSKPHRRLKTIKVSSGIPTNDKPDPKQLNPTLGQNLKAYLSNYCNTTTIHGVKYIGENGRYLIEKLLWLCIVVTVCSACILLINKTYHKWRTSPVIVSFETKETPIYEIPFPAVTLCPEIKVDASYFNFTNHFFRKLYRKNVTEKEEQIFDSLLLVCEKALYYANHFKIGVNRKFMNEDFIFDWIISEDEFITPNDTVVEFLGKDVLDLINLSLTEEGICYTFNMLPVDEILRHSDEFVKNKTKPEVKTRKWSLEEGYPPGDHLDSYPKRTFLAGYDGGLTIDGLYTNHTQLDFLCQEGLHGFKIALHHPSELPNMDKHFMLPLNQGVLVAIKPKMITVSKELRNYDPKDRSCYFAEEKYLALYKLYSQENCLSECLSNFTLSNCGCVSFWMPHTEGAKICGPSKSDCVKESKIGYLNYNKHNPNGDDKCECLPACTSLSYDIETSQTTWDWRELYRLYELLNLTELELNLNLSHFSKLVVYYKDFQFLTCKRHELYGIVDFFSNVGGLLGLFIGFSVISAIEIIYFFTLRVLCNLKKYGSDYWSGGTEVANS